MFAAHAVIQLYSGVMGAGMDPELLTRALTWQDGWRC